MIVVDTSIWIDFFNSPASQSAITLTKLIKDKESLCINGLIEMEILQGIKSNKQEKLMQRMLKPYQNYPDIPKSWLSLAKEIYRKCRKEGRTIRKSNDCIIAANALEHDLTIFHQDRDFTQISESFQNLKVLKP